LGHGGRLVGGSVNWVVVAVRIPIDGGRAVADSSLAERPVVVVVVVSRIKFRCDRCSSDRANCWIRQPDTETAREHRYQILIKIADCAGNESHSQLSHFAQASKQPKSVVKRNACFSRRQDDAAAQRTAASGWVRLPAAHPAPGPHCFGGWRSVGPLTKSRQHGRFPPGNQVVVCLHLLGMARGMDWIHSDIHPPVQATTRIRSDGEQ
jgi:hypothetical protein